MANGTAQRGGIMRRPEEGYVPLHQAMQRLFQDSVLLPSLLEGAAGGGGTAGTNLWETKDGYLVQLLLPGMRPESIQVSVEQGVLSASGEPAWQAPEDARPIWQSFGGQTGYRVQVPAEVDSATAEADYTHGVLTIRLPKAQHARPQTIKVTAR